MNIPEKYKTILQALLNLIESDTGEVYELTLKDIKKIEVYNMFPAEELIGTYSKDELCEKLNKNYLSMNKDNNTIYDTYDYKKAIRGHYRYI